MKKTIAAHQTNTAPRVRVQRLLRFMRKHVLARAVLIISALIFLLPFYWMVVTALQSRADLAAFPPRLLPQTWRWQNFREAVAFIPFWAYFGNSLLVALGATVGAVLSNPIIAYGFSQIRWKGRDFVFYVVIATIFIPFPVLMVALFDIFARLGWVDTFLPLIVPAFFGNAFSIFILRQFMLQIPAELGDAARLDGASEAQIFVRVILPLVKPALAIVALFAFVGSWNDFLGPLIYLQDERLYTLPIGLQFFRSIHDVEFNLLMAASTLAVLPLVALFLLCQRAFLQGITLGTKL